MTTEEKAWICGAAWALAEIERGPAGGGAVEDALSAAGITAETLRRAGVEEFDREPLRAPLARNRERAARFERRRPSPRGTGTEGGK